MGDNIESSRRQAEKVAFGQDEDEDGLVTVTAPDGAPSRRSSVAGHRRQWCAFHCLIWSAKNQNQWLSGTGRRSAEPQVGWNVRFTLNSGRSLHELICPLCAINGHFLVPAWTGLTPARFSHRKKSSTAESARHSGSCSPRSMWRRMSKASLRRAWSFSRSFVGRHLCALSNAVVMIFRVSGP